MRILAEQPLFPSCPACQRNPVHDPREPCGECIAAFGPMLRRGGASVSIEDFTAAQEAGRRAVARAYAAQMTIALAADHG